MKKVEVAILSYKKYNVNVFYIFVLLTDPSFPCLAAWCQTRIPCTQQGWPTKHLNNGRPFTLVYVSSFALKISNKTNPKHKTGLSVGKFTSSCSILQAHNYIRTCSMQGGHFFSQETCLVRYALPPPPNFDFRSSSRSYSSTRRMELELVQLYVEKLIL